MIKSRNEKNVLKIIFFAFTFILVTIISTITISYAWFTDTENEGADVSVKFGSVSVSGSTSTDFSAVLFLSSTELLPNYNNNAPVPVTRNLTITNNGTVSCFIRFKAVVKIYDGSSVLVQNASSYVNFVGITPVSGDGSWQTYNSDGYYYYCTNSTTLKPVASNGSATGQMSFTVYSSFGNQFEGKTLKVIFDIDAVQSVNNGTNNTLSTVVWG